MSKKNSNLQKFFLLFIIVPLFITCRGNTKGTLKFKDYPDLKLGFTTQNFQKSMPLSVESISELMLYAADQGFQFIEIRDDLAKLTTDECRTLASIADEKNLGIIYEIQRNLLDTNYFETFNKGLDNALQFSPPVILRSMISKSEFTGSPDKKGWTMDELVRIAKIADSCCTIAESKNALFLIENSDESFFGDGRTYYGLSDFFEKTSRVGLQFDMANPFRKSARVKSEPEEVSKFLSSLGSRWVSTHLKTIVETGGEMQPVLTESPLSVTEVVSQMGRQNARYVALELLTVENKQECFKNHDTSIQYLKEKGILEK